jgi:hypothetical protein
MRIRISGLANDFQNLDSNETKNILRSNDPATRQKISTISKGVSKMFGNSEHLNAPSTKSKADYETSKQLI